MHRMMNMNDVKLLGFFFVNFVFSERKMWSRQQAGKQADDVDEQDFHARVVNLYLNGISYVMAA